MRYDHSLEEARQSRKYRVGFFGFFVGWFILDVGLLSMVLGSGRSDDVFGYALFFALNVMFAYFCYCKWTNPKYKHLREKERKRQHFHALPVPRDPGNPT